VKLAAAARVWWAALLRPGRGRPRRPAFVTKAARAAYTALLVLAGLTVVCALTGLAVTQREDSRREAERHVALRLALDELQAVFGEIERFDDAQLRLIARRAGLAELRFDADPPRQDGREIQSLQNPQGRIVGWFSWVPDRAFARAMTWLWSLAAAIALGLGAAAVFAEQVAWRLSRALARSIGTTRKLISEDPLTGLPNRRAMLASLEDALAQRGSGFVALALLDLDGFREVNDTLGRAGGDAMLVSIAERLNARLPPGALFGRFEDDEFAVILRGDDARAVLALAGKLRLSLSPPGFMDQTGQVSACIGIAQAPDDGDSGEILARRAGLALVAAKHEGRGVVRRFEPQVETDYAERRCMLRELEVAIATRSLEVHYQPIVAAAGGGMIGVEALLRWNHPTLGAIPPSVFIPLAEQNGLMFQLGEIVLRRALTDGARWPQLFIGVNLSPLQIRNRRLVDLLTAIMIETGVAASRVVLEVTEGVLIDDLPETRQQLEALRALGAGIALDDFGTGYSSLSYLQKFPFDRLKIDRTFVASLGTSGNTGAIIQSIVTLGHALGMKVLAEGVETDEQRVLLRLAGCDEMQGYLFARPGPAEDIDKALAGQVALAQPAMA